MSQNALLSPGESSHSASPALWDADPAVLSTLRAIVADVAATGRGARFVVATPAGEPYPLVSAGTYRGQWRPVAAAVLERGEALAEAGTVAAPIHASPDFHGLRGALLLHCHRRHSAATVVPLVAAHAARVQAALAGAARQLQATWGAVDALMTALEAHDTETAQHSRAVQRLAHELGRAIELPASDCLQLEWAALLHDVGKIGVRVSLLQKAGPLCTREWGVMREHSALGERIVKAVPGLHAVGLAVRHHHEHWDGSGYPDRLHGAAIPLQARLVALIDAYECMIRGRPYRPALRPDEALHELRCSMGSQFDPAFLPLLPILAAHTGVLYP